MSSYLSQPYEIQAPQQAVDTRFMGTILSTLQNKYDANKAEIDKTQALYNNMLKGLRDIDNEYIAAKLKSAEAIMNEYKQKNGNLAYNTTKDTLLSALRAVTEDPIVQSAVSNKAKYDKYTTEVNELKKKDVSKYNDANYQYGLYKAGMSDYMAGKTKDLGSLNYTPYKDLTEAHLKSLKVIKDLKGKRFMEWVDPSDPTTKHRKEIDGLTQAEIHNYFGGLLTSEDIQQMTINGWAKYSQDETAAREAYKTTINSRIASYKQDLDLAEKASKNTAKTKKEREEAALKVNDLKETIASAEESLSYADTAPIDRIGYQLERGSYLNNLSNIASTEWSYSQEANDVYFETEKLAISRENLDLNKKKYELELLKAGLKADGTPADGEVSVSSTPSELTEDVDGIKNLKDFHDTQNKVVRDTAKEILTKLPEKEKDAFEAELKSRGIDIATMKLPAGSKYSSAATIMEAFEKTGLDKYVEYSTKMSKAYDAKRKAAVDIINVERDSYKEKFNEDPDKYVEGFNRMGKDIAVLSQGEDFWTGEDNKKMIDLKQKIDSFVKEAGGESNIKSYLQKNPNKVREFAELTDSMDKTYKGLGSFNAKAWVVPVDTKYGLTYRDVNLKEDAKEKVESTLADRSKRRSLSTMTVYNSINLLNEKTRGSVINMIDQANVEGEKFDAKTPMSIRLVGKDLEILQFQGTDKDGNKKYSKVLVNSGDAAYQKILTIADLNESSDIIYADDFVGGKVYKPKTSINDTESENNSFRKSAEKAIRESKNNIQGWFKIVPPEALTTAVDIKDTFDAVLKSKVDENVASSFSKTIGNNIEKVTMRPYVKTDSDLRKTFHYEISYNGKVIGDEDFGTQSIDQNTQYLIKQFPHMFSSNYILKSIYTSSNPEEQINKWSNIIK